MQNGSKYVPPHLRNRCNGVPSVHVDNDKTSHVIGFCHNYVPPHLRNRIRQIDCEYVPPHLRKRLHGVPSEKTYKKTIEVTDDHANLDADQGFDDTDNADQITESGNKNAVHMDYKQGCADMDSNNPKDSKIVFVNDLKNRSNEKFADQDDTNRDVADQGTTTNKNPTSFQ